MFDLNQEIDRWCRDIIRHGCARTSELNELKDHLHCLVEAHQAEGLTGQAAFVEAIRQMGDSDLITAEYAKNAPLLQRIVAYDQALQRSLLARFTGRQLMMFTLVYSLVCAAAMIVGAWWFDAGDQLVNWMLAIWLVPFLLVASNPDLRRAECAFFKRLINRTG